MTETTPPEPITPSAQLRPFRRALGWWFGVALWKRILGALVLGGIAGVAWGPGATSIAWIGERGDARGDGEEDERHHQHADQAHE